LITDPSSPMATPTELFISSGIEEKRAKETVKNPALTTALTAVIEQAKKLNEATLKNNINLYYQVASALPANCAAHRPLLVQYIADGKIDKNNLELAFKFVKKMGTDPIEPKDLDKEAGVGVVVTPEDIKRAVAEVFAANREQMVEQRYRFLTGPLLGKMRDQAPIKFANAKDVKDEFDAQLLALLGPKTEADNAKPVKKEAPKNASTAEAKKPEAAHEAKVEEEKELVRFPEPHENKQVNPEILAAHLARTKGVVVTRFPPEPNGFLHLGHAKSMNLNFSYAKKFNGYTFLRFDDTNPEAEKIEYINAIKEDVAWMGHKPAHVTHASEYFDKLYELAIELIKRGKAYVCHQVGDQIKQGRQDRTDSPWRDRPIEENLRLFEDMKNGKFKEGEATLRMKQDMKSENPVMRDLIAYRIKYTPHPHVGDKWVIYPSYDYTHCLNDSLEDITHSLCTLEFERRRESYNWLVDVLGLYRPLVWECSRLNVTHVVLSKRKLIKLVDGNHVTGWDDPRMPTIRGLRRRGYTPAAINDFCNRVGVTRTENLIAYEMLENCVREDLDVKVNRGMVVLDPIKVTITNADKEAREVTVPNHPRDPTKGSHTITCTSVLYIERADYRSTELKGYKRLVLGKSAVGLSHAGFILQANEEVKNEKGEVTEIKCTIDYNPPKKAAAFIHWVPQKKNGEAPTTAEVRLYDKLFKSPTLAAYKIEDAEKAKLPENKDKWLEDLNPNSLTVISHAYVDESVAEKVKEGEQIQFERNGYFVVDVETKPGHLVWNRTVSLKETKW